MSSCSKQRARLPKFFLPLAVTLLCSLELAFAAAPQNPLWLKAIAVARTNEVWVAGLVVTRSEVVYKGETNGVLERWDRSEPGPHGEVITRTVKLIEEGKDVTAKHAKSEKNKTPKSGKPKKLGPEGAGNPFSADVQDRLFIAPTNQTRKISGIDCVAYLFEVRNTNGPKTRGLAWLEKETGVPQEIENMTLDPLPDKKLKQLLITSRYEAGADGWYVKEMRTTGRINMFFISAEFHSVAVYSEYWKRPPRREGVTSDSK